MAQTDKELAYMQAHTRRQEQHQASPRVAYIETTAGTYKDVELVTDSPAHLKRWNHENYVGLKFPSGEVMWQNVGFIVSITFEEVSGRE